MREAVIVSAVRTAVGKAPRGILKYTRPDVLATHVVKEVLKRTPALEPGEIDNVLFGCSFPEGEQGMNIGRVVALRAGLPKEVPGATINRFCSSGLEAIATSAARIMAGYSEIEIAGGVENMSMVPMAGNKFSADPYMTANMPEIYMGMGLTAENVANQYKVSREDQDAFALQSHQRAAAAIKEGRYKDEIVPVPVTRRELQDDGTIKETTFDFDTDEGVRYDTNLEVLAKLRPVFMAGGSVTAGNSSQTSDGAAAVVIMSAKKAEELGIKPRAVFRGYAVGGVGPEVMGIGPMVAIPKVLKQVGLSIADIGLFELNEAFASQALAVMRELEMDPEITNVNGGAIALGHPLGCTGAKLTTSCLYEMERRDVRYGIVSMCIGGGMGAAGVLERI